MLMRGLALEAIWVARIVGALAYDLYSIPLQIAEEAIREHPERR